MTDDPFIGIWQMNPEENQYEFGPPPVVGLYTIEPQDEGYLVTMEWTDAQGQEHTSAYPGVPDGQWYPLPDNPEISMTMSKEGELTLISEAKHGDVPIAHARRVLSADHQTMTIYQSGTSPDGAAFTNTSVYKRIT